MWMIPEGSNIEEFKHSQVFGHTDNTVTPGRFKDEQRSTGGFGFFFLHLGSGVQGILAGSYMSYFQPPPDVNHSNPVVISIILSNCPVMSSPCRSLGWLLQVPAAAAAAAPFGAPAAEGWDAPGTCSPARQQEFSFQEEWI